MAAAATGEVRTTCADRGPRMAAAATGEVGTTCVGWGPRVAAAAGVDLRRPGGGGDDDLRRRRPADAGAQQLLVEIRQARGRRAGGRAVGAAAAREGGPGRWRIGERGNDLELGMGIGEAARHRRPAIAVPPRAAALNGRVPRLRPKHGTGPGMVQAWARTGPGRTVLGPCFFGPCQCRPVGPGPSGQLYSIGCLALDRPRADPVGHASGTLPALRWIFWCTCHGRWPAAVRCRMTASACVYGMRQRSW